MPVCKISGLTGIFTISFSIDCEILFIVNVFVEVLDFISVADTVNSVSPMPSKTFFRKSPCSSTKASSLFTRTSNIPLASFTLPLIVILLLLTTGFKPRETSGKIIVISGGVLSRFAGLYFFFFVIVTVSELSWILSKPEPTPLNL